MNHLLTECFRWYGPQDRVSLRDIRQCGATGLYTALHHIPYGEAWSRESIRARKNEIEDAGLTWEAVESLPVSEDIRMRTGDCDKHLANYRKSIENLAAEGVHVVTYNFMPVLDWVRTDLSHKLEDGSECLRYDPVHFAAFEVHLLKRADAENDYTPEQLEAAQAFIESMDPSKSHHFGQRIIDSFPGCKLGFTLDDIRGLLTGYRNIDAEGLRANLGHFLSEVIPTAESCGVRMAVHPDDPPFSILGLPRIVSTEPDLRALLDLVPSPSNGLCFCAGSLGAHQDNDLPGIVRRLGESIHAVHLRSVQHEPCGAFHEARHLEGCVPMAEVVDALLDLNRDRPAGRRLSFRPDHGHRILDDLKKPENPNPGYDYLGRMRGLAELRGLQQGLDFHRA